MKIPVPLSSSFITLVISDCDTRWMDKVFRELHSKIKKLKTLFIIFFCSSFIDIPIESCGNSSPLRVSLQATAPDILLILLRHGANPEPLDGGIQPALALLEKLTDFNETASYPYQLVSCLKILMLAIPSIIMPYKVCDKTNWKWWNNFKSFSFQPLVYAARKEMFLKKYSILLQHKLFVANRAFGVPELKHLCRFDKVYLKS